MDPFSLLYYEVAFEREFLTRNGTAFEDFFCDIMEKCHPGDFMRCCPWGRIGDRKNDGYLGSERTLFAVHAPVRASARDIVNKIDGDFAGAIPHWKDYFDTWAFVHNDRRGLCAPAMQRLLELREQHPCLNIVSWGHPELRQRAFRLAEADMAALLGPVPSRQELLSVRVRDVQQVLYAVSRQQPTAGREVPPVSDRKLEANGLSSHVRSLLSAGMALSDRVRQFLARHHEPTFGDGIAERFRQEYVAARDEDGDPDGIFMKLWGLVRVADTTPALEAAGLAVLAYLFETCDIFEDPNGVAAA